MTIPRRVKLPRSNKGAQNRISTDRRNPAEREPSRTKKVYWTGSTGVVRGQTQGVNPFEGPLAGRPPRPTGGVREARGEAGLSSGRLRGLKLDSRGSNLANQAPLTHSGAGNAGNNANKLPLDLSNDSDPVEVLQPDGSIQTEGLNNFATDVTLGQIDPEIQVLFGGRKISARQLTHEYLQMPTHFNVDILDQNGPARATNLNDLAVDVMLHQIDPNAQVSFGGKVVSAGTLAQNYLQSRKGVEVDYADDDASVQFFKPEIGDHYDRNATKTEVVPDDLSGPQLQSQTDSPQRPRYLAIGDKGQEVPITQDMIPGMIEGLLTQPDKVRNLYQVDQQNRRTDISVGEFIKNEGRPNKYLFVLKGGKKSTKVAANDVTALKALLSDPGKVITIHGLSPGGILLPAEYTVDELRERLTSTSPAS